MRCTVVQLFLFWLLPNLILVMPQLVSKETAETMRRPIYSHPRIPHAFPQIQTAYYISEQYYLSAYLGNGKDHEVPHRRHRENRTRTFPFNSWTAYRESYALVSREMAETMRRPIPLCKLNLNLTLIFLDCVNFIGLCVAKVPVSFITILLSIQFLDHILPDTCLGI